MQEEGDSLQPPPASWFNETPLNRAASRYLWWGLDSSTRRGYTTAFDSYMTFYKTNLASAAPPALLASLYTLTAWSADLGDRGITPKTIKSYLGGLRSAHVDGGYEDLSVFEYPVLNRVVQGIKRVRGDGVARERRPITRPIR